MITQEQINRGGSKLEIIRALLEREREGTNIPIPRSVWKYAGQSLDSVMPEIQRMREPLIVRGSHPNDYHGFIDVIPTFRDVTHTSVEEAIEKIESFMLGKHYIVRPGVYVGDISRENEGLRVHCEDWGQPYTPEAHILIQEQSPSPIIGSMLRHPNTNKLMIQYKDITDNNLMGRAPVSHAELEESSYWHHSSELEIEDKEIREAIEMYEKLETSGILDDSFAQQIEFGLRPLLFFQARPFKSFQPAKSYERAWNIHGKDFPIMTAMSCFGVTPEEGIEVSFYIDKPEAIDKPYGLILPHKIEESYPLHQRFGSLSVFCSDNFDWNFLHHGVYRFMKKADYSLVQLLVLGEARKDWRHNLGVFRESRLFSDGKHAAVIPVKYL
ncbi:MAG: hypothetical protein WC796_03625 [Candidatus Pacearchaeota archaeon]